MEVQIFKHPLFGEIRTMVMPDGQVGFVGKDVAEVLGYTKTSDAVRKHVDAEDKGVFKMETPGGMQSTVFVSESGIYSLILSSKLPQAREFKHWVTSEVLPQIRKTGGYIPVKEEDDEKTILAKSVQILMKTVDMQKGMLDAQRKEMTVQDKAIARLLPMAEYAEEVLLSPTCYTMTEVAKSLSMTVQELQHKLHHFRIIYRSPSGPWMLYAPFLKQGYEAYRTKMCDSRPGETKWTDTYLVWTERGKEFIHELFGSPLPLTPTPFQGEGSGKRR